MTGRRVVSSDALSEDGSDGRRVTGRSNSGGRVDRNDRNMAGGSGRSARSFRSSTSSGTSRGSRGQGSQPQGSQTQGSSASTASDRRSTQSRRGAQKGGSGNSGDSGKKDRRRSTKNADVTKSGTGKGKKTNGKAAKSSKADKTSKANKANKSGKTSKKDVERRDSGRVAQSGGRTVQSGAHESDGSSRDLTYDTSPRQSDPGEFVDPLTLDGEDVVAKTLTETSGTLGVAMRPKVVDFNARLKERRRANIRSIAMRITAVVAAIAVLAALIWLLFFSPVFRLEESQISVSGGNEWVSEDEIMEIASQQAGKSLLLVSGDDVVDQLNDIPGVTEAEVVKQFPNSMSVTVQAQKPAAMLQTPDGTLTAVDQEGRVLNSVNDASVDGIPVIDVDSVDDGQSDRAVLEALQILSGLSDDMRSRISSVSAETQDSITTELDDGTYTVVWGDSSDLELKSAVVDEILSDPDVIGDKQQVDVSAPLRPIIK